MAVCSMPDAVQGLFLVFVWDSYPARVHAMSRCSSLSSANTPCPKTGSHQTYDNNFL